jgi:hypothetical protein
MHCNFSDGATNAFLDHIKNNLAESNVNNNSEINITEPNLNYKNDLNKNNWNTANYSQKYSKYFSFMMLYTSQINRVIDLCNNSIKRKNFYIFLCNKYKNEDNETIYKCYMLFTKKLHMRIELFKNFNMILSTANPQSGLQY